MDLKEHVERTVANKVASGVALLVGFIVFIIASGLIVRLLWNWLMPDIFGVRELSWVEALGLLALTRILFGGFAFGGFAASGGGAHDRRRPHDRSEWWKHHPERADVTVCFVSTGRRLGCRRGRRGQADGIRRRDGAPRWSGADTGAGYSSPHLLTIEEMPQIVLLTGQSPLSMCG